MRCPMCLGKGYATDDDIKEYPHRCQNCNGKGFYSVDWKMVRCEVCNGSGKKPLTNEEWRRTCSAEEFAEWISNLAYACMRCGMSNGEAYCHTGYCIQDKEDAEKWLKETHDEM